MEKKVNNIEYRYERKFHIESENINRSEAIILSHPCVFRTIYHKRTINNIYLDSDNYLSYFQNVNGDEDRVKYRIRWYEENNKQIVCNPVLELKIKKGLVGYKKSFPLEAIDLKKVTNKYLRSIFQKSNLPPNILLCVENLNMSLINRYTRKYYKSSCDRYRLTLDWNIYNHLRSEEFHENRVVKERHSIIELKYDSKHDMRVHHVTSIFPFRISKNSKYVNGINRIWSSNS